MEGSFGGDFVQLDVSQGTGGGLEGLSRRRYP
jgi:hypothetical protein